MAMKFRGWLQLWVSCDNLPLLFIYYCYYYTFGGTFGGGCSLITILSIAADTCAQLILSGNHRNIVVPENFLVFLIFMTNVPESCSQGEASLILVFISLPATDVWTNSATTDCHLHNNFYTLTFSQTSPGFYVSAVQVFWKHSGKRKNCSLRAISSFPTVFSTHLENFLPFSSSLKLSFAESFSLEKSEICCLGKV